MRRGRSPRLWRFGAVLPPRSGPPGSDRPDWQQARPAWIRGALRRSQELPSGGWYAVDASRALGDRPRCYRVRGRELCFWRAGARLCAAPNACPHMGAPLAEGRVRGGCLICPWHGLALGPEGRGAWGLLPCHDDGVLFWVRLGAGEGATERPRLPARPRRALDAVVRMEARCEPEDVIANRLDPWHGVHLHPYAFARLRVVDQREDEITVRVAYRVAGPLAVEVDARFHCVDPRTIVMTIENGDGAGSVVETHATPIAPGRTAILEATLATSGRRGFALVRGAKPVLRPLVRRAARRLWADDARYAERLYELRTREPSRPVGVASLPVNSGGAGRAS